MPDLIDTSLAGPRALRAAVGFLGRLPEVERSVAEASGRAQGTLDQVLDRVRPLESELEELRRAADVLEARLATTESRVGELERTAQRLDETAAQLVMVGARLEGALEHVLDRVPGLSTSKAVRRGRAVARAVVAEQDGTD